MKTMKSQSGFSLIELMVTVGIIGILAAVAVPSFSQFQAKAKQSEAKSNLGGIYSAMQSFKAEWNIYFNDFRDIGYAPEGLLRYDTGFSAAQAKAVITGIGYSGPSAPGGVPADAVDFNSAAYCADKAVANSAGNQPCTESGFVVAVDKAATSSGTAFVAEAAGSIINGNQPDIWTINESKVLANVQSGLVVK